MPFKTSLKQSSPFSPAELKALDWFRQRYWPGNNSTTVPDEAIAYMLLRLALGKPAEVAGWLEQGLNYREAEGLALSQWLNERLASHPLYRQNPTSPKP